ncbi:Uncharacterized protein HZ326_23037 [Fusarium oxysporum f. sp. albedinis]|nr:Uncharacterized protein HZ326_23037 [Fusarium oxysporum f. sp. albedinis]
MYGQVFRSDLCSSPYSPICRVHEESVGATVVMQVHYTPGFCFILITFHSLGHPILNSIADTRVFFLFRYTVSWSTLPNEAHCFPA